MRLFRRIAEFFNGGKRFESVYANASAEELMETVERLMLDVVRSYEPLASERGSRFAKAEYAAFMFFWIHHWHDRLPKEMRDYGKFLDLLKWKAEEGAIAVRSYHSLNFSKGWDSEKWFDDRVRLYQSISNNEPQTGSSSGPPSLFAACHMLATLASRNSALAMMPSVTRSHDLLEQCLSQGAFPDALEQYNLYRHARDSLETTIPKITEAISVMHLRRLANK